MKPLHFLGTILLALILTTGLAGCDASNPAADEQVTDGVAQLNMMLASELSLSADQYDLVEATGARYGEGDGRDPAFLWRLAQQLSVTLTVEQKEALLARAAEMAERFGERGLDGPFGRPGAEHPEGSMGVGGGMRPGGGGQGQGHGHGPNGLERAGAGPNNGIGAILTEAQRTLLRELMESFASARQGILEQLRTATEGNRAAIVAELQALNETVRTEVEAWLAANLSDDQKAEVAALEAERLAARKAVRAAIEEILDVSADVLEKYHNDFVIAVEAARFLRDNGDLEGFRAAVKEAAEARDAAIENILSDEAWEIYQIHRALAMRASHMPQGGPGGQNGPGGMHQGGSGGQNGPGGMQQGGPGGSGNGSPG